MNYIDINHDPTLILLVECDQGSQFPHQTYLFIGKSCPSTNINVVEILQAKPPILEEYFVLFYLNPNLYLIISWIT